MSHSEIRQREKKGTGAVLFIHGICGTPEHFRAVISLEPLVPQRWSVVNLCLPGHGGSVEEFAHSSRAAWESHAQAAFQRLAREHERIYLVGHSMGTLLCLLLAAEYPEKVGGVFLLNVPMVPFVRPRAVSACLRLCFGKLRKDNPRDMALLAACGITSTRKLWKYIPWIPRFLDLLVLIGKTRKGLGCISVTGQVWQSCRDELVANGSAGILREKTSLPVVEMEDSGHFYYTPEDAQRIRTAFREFITPGE